MRLLDPARSLRTVRTLALSATTTTSTSISSSGTKELVCLEQRADLMAVGSVGHVTLLDPRRSEVRGLPPPLLQ